MSTLIEVANDDEWEKLSAEIPASTLQVIYFKAEWALPCKQMTTVLQTLASSYPITSPLTTAWYSMDAEECMDTSDSFNVTAVPFLVLRRGTSIIETVSGSDATKVRAAIEKHVKNPASSSSGSIPASSTEAPAKNLSAYAPTASDPATAPEYSSGETKESKEDLHKRLAGLVKAASVMLFMKGTPSAPQCGFSRQLVAILRENSVKYGFFNILADDEVRQGLKEFADWPTFPQLWVDGELVGGLDIVKEELASDPDFFKAHSVPAKKTAV